MKEIAKMTIEIELAATQDVIRHTFHLIPSPASAGKPRMAPDGIASIRG